MASTSHRLEREPPTQLRALSFGHMLAKVQQAEDALEACEREAAADFRQLRESWQQAWTPGRIIAAGLGAGFLVGRAQPVRTAARLGGMGRLFQMFSAVTSLVAGKQAHDAAEMAEQAVDESGMQADGVDADAAPTDPGTTRVAEAVGT